MTVEELHRLLDAESSDLVAVSTGGPAIASRQADYVNRRKKIRRGLEQFAITDPNGFRDLWDWYGYYSQNLGRYHERRTFVRDLYEPVYKALDQLVEDLGVGLDDERTGWERVDDQLVQLRTRHATAETVEDFQSIGLLCRELFVSLGEACVDPKRHSGETLVDRLCAAVNEAAPGSGKQELRSLVKAAVNFANKVQHDRSARALDARLVAEATIASIRIVRALVEPDSPDDPVF